MIPVIENIESSNTTGIKAVIFDQFGVMVDFGPNFFLGSLAINITKSFYQIISDCGVSMGLKKDSIYQFYILYLQYKDVYDQLERGEISGPEYAEFMYDKMSDEVIFYRLLRSK